MIRPVAPGDVVALKAIIDATGLFASEMLDGMLAAHLGGAGGDEIWLADADADGNALAVAFCAPEPMTAGTWNLYLIAVRPDRQGEGRGAALVRHVEAALAARAAHLLLIETSGSPDFQRTRTFYGKCGYTEEARIRDFYRSGEDKVVFRKALAGSPGADPTADQPP